MFMGIEPFTGAWVAYHEFLMINLGWIHLESTKKEFIGHKWEVFLLHCVIWDGKIHSKSGAYLLMTTHIKGHRRKKLLLFVCSPSLLLASSSILLLRDCLTSFRNYFFEILMYIEELLRHLTSWTEQISDFCHFYWDTEIVGLDGS